MGKRLVTHPILDCDKDTPVNFTFNGKVMKARKGEVISSALLANGIHIFGKHHIDGSGRGIFCANGQCSNCLLLADSTPVKSCMTPVEEGVDVQSLDGLPELISDDTPVAPPPDVPELVIDVLIVGGGPAGLSAAIELGSKGIKTIVVDDKQELGGKLTLQTHNFFGSKNESMAGMRGNDIGRVLSKKVKSMHSVSVWLNSPVVGVFFDGKVGIVNNGIYRLVKPKVLVVTAGAREKALSFPGCDLPGVYGAGAFQTLVNRDLVKCAERVLVVGGGNIGLIVAYHAMQAGIDVAAVVEALPRCGGYKVHLDKIKRLGVPVFTSHTVSRAEGKDHVEKAIITEIDGNFKPVPGKEMAYDVDTILIAVGISPMNELAVKAREYGIPTYTAGDAEEIAEASSAMFTGKIIGRQILAEMGLDAEIKPEWNDLVEVLKSKPGKEHEWKKPDFKVNGLTPVIRCVQEIPCDPCAAACSLGNIVMDGGSIMDIPRFDGECSGCLMCLSTCPGLAITIVDDRNGDGKNTKIVLPWEMPDGLIGAGSSVITTGFNGEMIGNGKVLGITESPILNKRKVVHLLVPVGHALEIAGIRVREPNPGVKPEKGTGTGKDDMIVCRCQRVTKEQIVHCIKSGCTDLNSLKAALNLRFGACGGKTCTDLVMMIIREMGVDPGDVEPATVRPFNLEIPLDSFLKEGK